MSQLSHLDDSGSLRMVDVSSKPVTQRKARARGQVSASAETVARVRDNRMAKGSVLEAARLAGIMAAKNTGQLIPLCHPLQLSHVQVEFTLTDAGVDIEATTLAEGKTGVEMEALVAVSAAALTIYDMCKAMDRTMEIGNIRLMEKTGGRSGHFIRSD
jgi:cyclic pyranopterin phosphate synthase